MDSEEFINFVRETPFSSRTTVAEQYAQFLQTRKGIPPQKPAPKSAAERMREYRARKRPIADKPAPKSGAERTREYRARKKLRASTTTIENVGEEIEIHEANHMYVSLPRSLADEEFEKRFTSNRFGFSCSVCDRLWFDQDLRPVPVRATRF